MRLATVRGVDGTSAVRVEGDRYVKLGFADVGALLAHPDWRALAAAEGTQHELATARWAPLIPRPDKIICVGLNYRNHIEESGASIPEFPTLFSKFAGALIGARDDIITPPESDAIDFEAELALVIGASIRRADAEEATAAIAGFTVMNDVSARDWQMRTDEWLQGKTFESTTPLGPVLVTSDDLPGGVNPEVAVRCIVSGESMQEANTRELVFKPVDLVRYISTIITLLPGDVIATGTPGGVGGARKPPRFLGNGELVVTEIERIGRLENVVRRG